MFLLLLIESWLCCRAVLIPLLQHRLLLNTLQAMDMQGPLEIASLEIASLACQLIKASPHELILVNNLVRLHQLHCFSWHHAFACTLKSLAQWQWQHQDKHAVALLVLPNCCTGEALLDLVCDFHEHVRTVWLADNEAMISMQAQTHRHPNHRHLHHRLLRPPKGVCLRLHLYHSQHW